MAGLPQRSAAGFARAPGRPGLSVALRFAEVSKRYGGGLFGRRAGTLALDGVSLEIRRGSRACLLGPNGAGKSTAIRLLLGALQPTSGRVELLGEPLDGRGYLDARRRTGVVPQGPGMYQDLSLAEYLRLARRLYGRGDVDGAVEAMGLRTHMGKMLSHLSGGFQRRAVIAAALLSDPDVLLLDEPTVGLDPLAANEVHQSLARALEGRTTLLCTHNLVEAEALCDEVVILQNGRVRLHEPLTELRRRARTGLRFAARGGADGLVAALAHRGLEATADDGGVLVHVEQPELAAPELLRALLADGVEVYECRPLQATLESLFLDAVRGGS